jgi:hypothetical protein
MQIPSSSFAFFFFAAVSIVKGNAHKSDILCRDATDNVTFVDNVLSHLPSITKTKGPGNQNSKLGLEMTYKATMKIPSSVGNILTTAKKGKFDDLFGNSLSSSSDSNSEIKKIEERLALCTQSDPHFCHFSSPLPSDKIETPATCESIDVRKPWSRASRAERDGFLDGVSCLFNRPGIFKSGKVQSANIAEDFALVHAFQNDLRECVSPFLGTTTMLMGRSSYHYQVHNGSAFLPCHRLFSLSWVNTLRSQCSYRGPILYGDWSTYADKGEYLSSQDIWGEDNLGDLSCPVKTGRFANCEWPLWSIATSSPTLRVLTHSVLPFPRVVPLCWKYPCCINVGVLVPASAMS